MVWIFARLNFIRDMNKLVNHALTIVFFLAILNSRLLADAPLVDNYATFISEGDYRNSQGEWLTKVSEVIQQDRARVHKFGNPDGDEVDATFRSAEARAKIPILIQEGDIDPGVLATLRARDEISIFVSLHEDPNGRQYLVIRERQIKAE